MQAAYRVRAGEERDLGALAGVELRAARLFSGRGVPDAVLEETTPRSELEEARARGLLWVAVDGSDAVVGFAHVIELEGSAHLEELDVDPAHGRRGIGAALVEQACVAARRRGHEFLTLTTYADVPWNAPFFERLGFRVLAQGEQSPPLRRLIAVEAGRGLDPSRRVAMRRRATLRFIALRWAAAGWAAAVVLLSMIATTRPLTVVRWYPMLPGRDKTGHFLLMGGLAGVAMLALAGARIGERRVSPVAILAGASLLVFVEEGIQYWMPFRNFSWFDLAFSLMGVAFFGGLAWGWQAWRRRRVR